MWCLKNVWKYSHIFGGQKISEKFSVQPIKDCKINLDLDTFREVNWAENFSTFPHTSLTRKILCIWHLPTNFMFIYEVRQCCANNLISIHQKFIAFQFLLSRKHFSLYFIILVLLLPSHINISCYATRR